MDEIKRYRAEILPGIRVDVVQARAYDAVVALLRMEDALQTASDTVWCPLFKEAGWDFEATKEPAVAFLTRLRRQVIAAPQSDATAT